MQETQISLFDFITAAVETVPQVFTAPSPPEKVETVASGGFVSLAQKHLAKTEPLFFQFKNKTLAEIELIDHAQTKRFSDTATFPLWCALLWTAQTIALEEIYRELDKRFLDNCAGKLWLREPSGRIHRAGFDYAPSFDFQNPARLTIPNPHIQFRTAKNSPITATGYKSHFLTCVPFNDVRTMEEFIELIIKHHFKINADISFTGGGEQDFL